MVFARLAELFSLSAPRLIEENPRSVETNFPVTAHNENAADGKQKATDVATLEEEEKRHPLLHVRVLTTV